MGLTLRGQVQEGRIVLANAVTLPDGTEVEVRIEPIKAPSTNAASQEVEDFMALPVFGMWQDRGDMKDSAAWVRQEREKWYQRVLRQG